MDLPPPVPRATDPDWSRIGRNVWIVGLVLSASLGGILYMTGKSLDLSVSAATPFAILSTLAGWGIVMKGKQGLISVSIAGVLLAAMFIVAYLAAQ